MKRIPVLLFSGITILLLSIGFSCSKNSSGGDNTNNPAVKDSSLLNIGNNIIVPGYQLLAHAVNSLDSAITDFNAGPDGTKLSNVQTLFKSAYIAWQSVSEYNYFGPAYNSQPVLSTLNIFPTSTSLIENNISTNDYNVSTFANTAAKGFPALDYLLFNASNNVLLNDYTTNANATSRQTYLAAVSADIKAQVNVVLNAWLASGGNYINTFINGTGNSISGSLGLLLNSLNQDFEILKNDRLGIPLGKIPVGSSSPIAPQEAEAYYSGISAQLALAQLNAIQNIYLGTGANGNGHGLINYLVKAKVKYNDGLLSETIKTAIALDISDMQSVADPFSQTIQTNPAPAEAAFAQSQKLVALLKTDMPSGLGILITYGDN